MTNLLAGKQGIIFGVANERSYAWHMAHTLATHGASCGFTHLPGEKNQRRTARALDKIDAIESPWLTPCDASSDQDIQAVFDKWAADHDRLDFVIHSIAFADREWLQPGNFVKTPREAYLSAVDISAYTLVAMARAAQPLMAKSGGGSILAMSYYGSEKVVSGYNIMGVAKAALESSTRYLAGELGEHNIRVNTISGGPLKTLAASAVGGIDTMLEMGEKASPLRRNVEGSDVGGAAAFLVSDLAAGITGENIYVDCGLNIVGAAV